MSDYANDIKRRIDNADQMIQLVEELRGSSFIDTDDERALNRIKEHAMGIESRAREEADLLERDWTMITQKTESVLDDLHAIEEMLEDAGAIEHDERGHLTPAHDDAPAELEELVSFLTQAEGAWRQTLSAANEVRDEAEDFAGAY